ncbi:hypothetical protein DL93DRAFT_2085613 [Clavulina sp. PMI_390]|nr:hypothetical protein DL93DRAFT_2085613 [Clavulina sp. PMI_390]
MTQHPTLTDRRRRTVHSALDNAPKGFSAPRLAIPGRRRRHLGMRGVCDSDVLTFLEILADHCHCQLSRSRRGCEPIIPRTMARSITAMHSAEDFVSDPNRNRWVPWGRDMVLCCEAPVPKWCSIYDSKLEQFGSNQNAQDPNDRPLGAYGLF